MPAAEVNAILSPDAWRAIGVLIGGVATLAIFSFLIKENAFFRFFEHVFIGIGVGLGIVQTIKNYMWPKAFKPVIYAMMRWTEEGSTEPASLWNLVFLIPMAFGCLYYCIYSKRYGWLARLVIGFSLGWGGGLALKAFCAQTIPQIIASFKPLVVLAPSGGVDLATSVSNTIFVLTLLCVMTYFFFSFDHDRPVIRQVSSAGRWLMMICFGAFFGSTVMARMALLVERLEFLSFEWWRNFHVLWQLMQGGDLPK